MRTLAGRRLRRREFPIVGILRGIQDRVCLTHRWPLVDVDCHPPIHGVLTNRGSGENSGDGDVLLTAGFRSWADSGHQHRAARQLTARAARDEPLGEEHRQDRHQQEQHAEFPHAAMVGLLA